MREAGAWQKIIDNKTYARMTPMAQFLWAGALAHLGYLDEAEDILAGLEIPDLREGEISLSELYAYIQCEKARRNGVSLISDDVEIPFHYDFRMTPKQVCRRIITCDNRAF